MPVEPSPKAVDIARLAEAMQKRNEIADVTAETLERADALYDYFRDLYCQERAASLAAEDRSRRAEHSERIMREERDGLKSRLAHALDERDDAAAKLADLRWERHCLNNAMAMVLPLLETLDGMPSVDEVMPRVRELLAGDKARRHLFEGQGEG